MQYFIKSRSNFSAGSTAYMFTAFFFLMDNLFFKQIISPKVHAFDAQQRNSCQTKELEEDQEDQRDAAANV